MTKLKDEICHECRSWPCRCQVERNRMKKRTNEELVEELVEAAKHLLEQFPETDLGYPSCMVDYEGEWIEGVVDDQVVWALNNLRDKLEALDESQAQN